MRIKEITFSVTRAMPLYPISKRKEDEYANVKPFASCTVEFDMDDPTEITKANLEIVKAVVMEAMSHAKSVAFTSVVEFSKEFRELYKTKD